jgi:aminoglycoside phosphotransferase (APT) family kinase protein
VPVPRPLGYCEDAAVNGAPFYVMQHLDGVVVREPADVPDGFGVAQREPLTWSLVDTLAQIHAQDADAVGLGRLGRREDYLGRQLLRWQRQYDQVRSRELPALEEVHRRLLDAKPPQQRDAIVHGDYRIDNVIFGRQPVVIGVLDWELCTLGDPLADLGGLLVQWVHPDEDGSFMLGRTPMQLPGFPTREQIAARYAAATSLDVSGIDYYMAFAYWRLACIGEGVYARFRDGAMGDQDDGGIVRRLGEQVVMLAELALERIG